MRPATYTGHSMMKKRREVMLRYCWGKAVDTIKGACSPKTSTTKRSGNHDEASLGEFIDRTNGICNTLKTLDEEEELRMPRWDLVRGRTSMGSQWYMQAVVDEIVLSNSDPNKHPSNWNLGKLFREFIQIGGEILNEYFAEIKEEDLLSSLEHVYGVNTIDADTFSLPNLPVPPNDFTGIRKKVSSLRRWFAICADDAAKKGRYQVTANLLRKYLSDFLIASYLELVHESGFDDTYIQEVEREVMLKSLDRFWRDHLINMNRLSSAVNVRSFGHRNPLEEYKIDGCRFFISMLSATRRQTVESLLQYWSSSVESEELATP